MKNCSLLFFVFALLVAGCRKEAATFSNDSNAGAVALNKTTVDQTGTTVDGAEFNFGCFVETLPSGEIIQMCKPANWNGELILYAHGYVSEFEPLRLPDETVAYAPLFTSLGYAFATTSYSENGLAIQSGITSILNLRKRFIQDFGQPSHIYLAGGSEGSVVTTLAIERNPELFSGGLPLCGPCGDFQKQINYYGDFRVLFDYFFPKLLPGNVNNVPDQLIANWQTVYVPAILQAIAAKPATTLKLLNTAHAAYVPGDNTTIGATVIGVLRYDVFASRDATRKLGGQPFDNRNTIYFGTGSVLEDALLNIKVQRFGADRNALQTVQRYYETSGRINIPVVSGHTTLDPIIPFWHLPLYQIKTLLQGRAALFTGIPVQRYGHCTFTEAELVSGFALLVQKVKGVLLTRAQQLIEQSSATDGKIVKAVRMK